MTSGLGTRLRILLDHLPRVRLTVRDPFEGGWVSPILWVGIKARGWIGKPLDPRLWHLTWRFTPTK